MHIWEAREKVVSIVKAKKKSGWNNSFGNVDG